MKIFYDFAVATYSPLCLLYSRTRNVAIFQNFAMATTENNNNAQSIFPKNWRYIMNYCSYT